MAICSNAKPPVSTEIQIQSFKLRKANPNIRPISYEEWRAEMAEG